MLDTLKIKNLAVIDQTEISFEKGLNILSGETGAGKSIILEAIALILGGRATSDLIRTGCDEAIVEGLFQTENLKWINQRLLDAGFETTDGVLLIKRVVSQTGKHRIYINGELATLTTLQKICEGLVDLCGQHEHQSLLKSAMQMELLDRYGSLEKESTQYLETWSEYQKLKHELAELLSDSTDLSKRKDFILFQIQELEKADLKPNEEESLQKEKKLLQSAGNRTQCIEDARDALENEESGALTGLRLALQKIKNLAQIDADSAETLLPSINEALAHAESAAILLNRLASQNELDPERLEFLQDRLAQLAELRRKYGSSTSEMMDTFSKLKLEASKLENSEEHAQKIKEEISLLEASLIKMADVLSKKRNKASKVLADSVTGELKDLKMAEAKFEVSLIKADSIEGYSSTGADEIDFKIRTNKGDDSKPLAKVASGGELSRLMLAIRRVIADRGGIGVYLFDEIDAGIGGQTAFEVGKKLHSVSKHNQVICITHLPQVAAFADHHLTVCKKTQGARTVTTVIELKAKDRKEEIARMLGGPTLTKKSLENAAELLGLAAR